MNGYFKSTAISELKVPQIGYLVCAGCTCGGYNDEVCMIARPRIYKLEKSVCQVQCNWGTGS